MSDLLASPRSLTLASSSAPVSIRLLVMQQLHYCTAAEVLPPDCPKIPPKR
jgi:hypothetical protein